MKKIIMRFAVYWVIHVIQNHIKGQEILSKCWLCWIYYSGICLTIAWVPWKLKNKNMNEVLQWVLLVIALSIPPIIVSLISYFANKKKTAAETESIQLKNKITKEINYDQLKKDNKHKDIKNKIEILSRLTQLEEEIKNKSTKTDSDQKKLTALECLKKEFKETLNESETPEKPLLVKKKNKKGSKQTEKS